jgi:hypothetical protein
VLEGATRSFGTYAEQKKADGPEYSRLKIEFTFE